MEKVLVFYHNNQEVYFIHKGSSQHRDISSVELMQYTGLKDKNSVEIYESDILSHKFTDVGKRSREYRGFVVYIAPSFYLDLIRWVDGVAEDGDPVWFIRLGRAKYEMEIIGNIYENPELLGDNHERI